MPVDTEVGLGPGNTVLDGDLAPPQKTGTVPLQFSAHVYCGQTVAHLSYCWALVMVALTILHSVNDFSVRHQPRNNNNNNNNGSSHDRRKRLRRVRNYYKAATDALRFPWRRVTIWRFLMLLCYGSWKQTNGGVMRPFIWRRLWVCNIVAVDGVYSAATPSIRDWGPVVCATGFVYCAGLPLRSWRRRYIWRWLTTSSLFQRYVYASCSVNKASFDDWHQWQLYFCQSVLLMHGTNYVFQLVLDHYRRPCVVSAVRIYPPICT